MSTVAIYQGSMEPALTFDRVRVMVDSQWIRANAELLHYVKASDGVWIASCDLPQYESEVAKKQLPTSRL